MNVAQSSPPVDTPAISARPYQSPSGLIDSNDAQPKSTSSEATRSSIAEKPISAAEEPPQPSAPQSSDTAAAKTDAAAKKATEQVAANAPPPQAEPVPAPSPTVDEMHVEVQGRRNDQSGTAQARDAAKQKTAEGFQEQEKNVSEFKSPRKEAPKAGAGAMTTQAGRTLGMVNKAEKDRDDGVMRSVAGRRFRKQSGMWVDTEYSSDNKIFDVARGSERYRSLVADEPEIKRIADELDGLVIVVWKGRTYRIR
jgi:hypothetical protein